MPHHQAARSVANALGGRAQEEQRQEAVLGGPALRAWARSDRDDPSGLSNLSFMILRIEAG